MDRNLNKSRSFLICVVLTFVTAMVYYQVCTYNFVGYDDHTYVYENSNIQAGITLKAIKWAFTSGHAANWHPLTWLSHMLDWQLYGDNASGHHITNLVFHIVNTLLLFIVLKQMTSALWQSAFVAALFALHPLHVESVAWISERKDVLSTFFWILTMWAYQRYVKKPCIVRYILIILTFVLGLMSKPMLVTLPFVLLLLDYWPLERFGQRTFFYLIREKIPLFVLSAASSVITFIAQRSGGAMTHITSLTLKFNIYNAFISYVKYIEKMVWPAKLAFFYPIVIIQYTSVLYAVISAGLLLAATILVLRYAKTHRYLLTGWFWYLGTLVPVIGLVQVGGQAMADRYTYMTLTGLFIIISWGVTELLSKLPYRKVILWPALLIVLSILSICTYQQTRYWKDSRTLCEHSLKVTENNYIAHFGMAKSLLELDMFSEAAVECQKYLQLKPDDPEVLDMLGTSLSRQSKYEQAVKYYTKALQIKPDFTKAHFNLGFALALQGKFNKAIAHFSKTLQLDPNYTTAHYRLGQILIETGKINEAIQHLEDSLRLKPDWVEPMNDLAWVLAASDKTTIRNPDKAVGLALRACELTNYKKPEILDTLAIAYAATGNFSKAVETAQKAIELFQPDERQELKEQIQSRLVLFKAGIPYIETKK